MNRIAKQFHINRLRQQAWADRRFAEDLYTQIERIERRDLDYQCRGCQQFLAADEVETRIPTDEEIARKFDGMKFDEVFAKHHLDHEGNRCGPVEQTCFR